MDKIEMREWVANLEEMVDGKLRKWKKNNVVQSSDDVNLHWQFGETIMMLNIVWKDKTESVTFHCVGPVECHRFVFHGLTEKTFNKIADRVGNLAMAIMHPPIDPLEDDRRTAR